MLRALPVAWRPDGEALGRRTWSGGAGDVQRPQGAREGGLIGAVCVGERVDQGLDGGRGRARLEQDLEILSDKVFREKPILSAADGPIAKYRKWFSQFYVA